MADFDNSNFTGNTDDASTQATEGQNPQASPGADQVQQGAYQVQPGAYQTSQGAYQAPSSFQQSSQTSASQNYYASVTVPAYANNAANATVNAASAKKKGSGAKTFFLAFLGAALACGLFAGGLALTGNLNFGGSSSGVVSAGGTSDDGSSSGTSGSSGGTITIENEDVTLAEVVAAKCLPSVVSIYVYTNASSYYGYGYGYGYGNSGTDSDSTTLELSALGSGVVLTEDGYIITNYHVVEGSAALKVTIEGAEYDAEVVGYDSSSDVAVVKAQNVSGLTPIEIGDSDSLTVGEWVMTIGSPYGYEQSVATGIVSATSRSQIYSENDGSYTYYTNMIQTDAAINSGNSGGALVDSKGKLIGINTLITSSSGSYSGVGFAIPVNYAYNIATQIMNGETPTHAQLGISLTSVTSDIASRYGLSVDYGAYVSAVSVDSGAEAAGIQAGDIIVAFNGKKIESGSDLILAVREKNPGDQVTVTVNREGESIDFEVTLGSDESTQSATEESTQQESSSPWGR